MTELLVNFHFLRPHWLWLIIPMTALVVLTRIYYVRENCWSRVVDKKLLPYLIPSTKAGTHHKPTIAYICIFLLMLGLIIALAGPAYQKKIQPAYTSNKNLFIVLDLSASMYAQDVFPSRLERAKYKISNLLTPHFEDRVALIATAEDAYTVTPLTDDTNTLLNMLVDLTPQTLPAWQSNQFNLDKAFIKIEQMMENNNLEAKNSHVIVITASKITDAAVAQAKKINLSIDILAIGKPTSVPINIPDAGLLKDAQGNQTIVKLNFNNLSQAANSLNGNLILVTKDNRDTQALLNNWHSVADNYQRDQEQKLDIWQEEGPWLLILLVPLCAIFFRRGLLLVFILYLELPHITPAYAQETSTAPISNMWKSYTQQGVEKYQAGDYEAAAKFFSQEQNDIDRYNHANSLVQLQQYTQALEIYSKLLETLGTESTLYQDTLHNHQLVTDFLNNQKNNNNQKNENQDSQKDNNQDNQNNNNEHQENSGDQSQEADQQNNQKGNNKDNQKGNNQQQQKQNPSDDSNAQEMSQQNNQKDNKDNKDNQKNENQIAAKQADTVEDKPEDAENQSLETTTANKLEQLTPEQAQELQQWLNQIPQQQNHDLLQRKFQQQYNRKRQ